MSGRRLNSRYRLDSLVGRGGMAEVWRGQDLRLGREVAVKLLDRSDPVLLARFRREARTVAGLSHPNIVAGYDLGTDDGSTYLVMEFVEGGSLAARLDAGPLAIGDAVAIAGQVCDALTAAHDAGVVHRDIKPANILLTPTGTVKVCDFGIARLQHADQKGLTATGTVIGTSEFMAPEQASGDPVDARTDLYALGCVLYAMLTGTPPFSGDSPLSVLSQHLHRAPAPLASHRPDVPAALADLVDRMLAKRPADRPADAGEARAGLADAVAAASSGEGAGTVPLATTVTPAGRSTRVLPTAGPPATMPAPAPATGLPAEHAAAGRWRRAAVAAAALVAAGAAAVAVVALLRSPDPAGTGPITAPTIIAPSASPTVSGPAEWANVVIAEIRDRAAVGQLDPEAVGDLEEIVDELVSEFAEDGVADAAEEAEDLREELDDLLRDGRISATGYRAVSDVVDRLVASLSGATAAN